MSSLKRFSTEEEKREHFDVYSPQMCSNLFEAHPDERFDLVIVDEAQDFHKNWFNSLNNITGQDGKIFFFYDPLQTTIENSMTEILRKPKDVNFPVFNFNANYRNSSTISNFLSKLIIKYFPEIKLRYSTHSKTHVGRNIELIEAENFEDIIDKTINKVKSLINKDGFKASDIVILGVDSMRPSDYGTKKSMTAELRALGLEVINAWDYSKPYLEAGMDNNISFSDVRSFKGLEKSAVILVNFKEVNKDNIQRIYTGLSRARGDLTVISYKTALDKIKEIN
jgi:superfamily I DNA and RNA helicase